MDVIKVAGVCVKVEIHRSVITVFYTPKNPDNERTKDDFWRNCAMFSVNVIDRKKYCLG